MGELDNNTTITQTQGTQQQSTGTQQTNQQVTQPTTTGSDTTTKADAELFSKLDDIIAKRTDGMLKSILKSNGLDGDELSGVLNDYKTAKANEKTKADERVSALERENEAMKAEILNGKLNTASIAAADKLGLDTKYIDKIVKLADMNGVVANGAIDEVKLSEALKKVSEDCPFFKKSDSGTSGSGFTNIGADTGHNGNSGSTGNAGDTSYLAKLRKIAGLTDKGEK